MKRTIRSAWLALTTAGALLTMGCAAGIGTATSDPIAIDHPPDVESVRLAVDQWVAGWSPGRRAWTGEELRHLYARGPNAIRVFDNVEGDIVELRSFEEYQDERVPMMAPMRGWKIELVEPAEIRVIGEMAYTTFVFEGGEDPSNAGAFGIRQYGTLVWERRGSEWVIVHEHLTADTIR